MHVYCVYHFSIALYGIAISASTLGVLPDTRVYRTSELVWC